MLYFSLVEPIYIFDIYLQWYKLGSSLNIKLQL